MPPPEPQAIHALADYAGFLAALGGTGVEYTVVGGCAVGAYAHLQGARVLSKDLDIYLAREDLTDCLRWVSAQGHTILKRPVPRALPVAVVEWGGLLVDLLTEGLGLAPPAVVAERARVFCLGALEVPVASPFDLLANKLAVARERDLAHAAALRAFIEEEIVADFGAAAPARVRLRSARRLLELTGEARLGEGLTERLLPLAHDPALRRFLVAHAATDEQARAAMMSADDPTLAEIYRAR